MVLWQVDGCFEKASFNINFFLVQQIRDIGF
jgi:hypothetical protein